MSARERIEFKVISFMHSTLYGIFVNPYEMLREAGVSKDQRVLEIGFGPGFFTIPAGKLVGPKGQVYAIDTNPVAIEVVQRKVNEEGLMNINVSLRDALSTEFEDESFDLCFLFGVFHAFKDTDPLVREMHRVLAPRGLMAIQSGRVGSDKTKKLVTKDGLFIHETGRKIMKFQKQ